MTDRHDPMVVNAQWLHAHLDDPDLRILDCTTYMFPQPVGPSWIESGQADYATAHIPGAEHVDMVEDLSDPEGRYPCTLPQGRALDALLERLGIGDEHRIILYGRSALPTITRAWFVLHVLGHRRIAILDGGFDAWRGAGFPLTDEAPRFAATQHRSRRLARKLADLDEIRQAMKDSSALLVNSLSSEQFSGTGGAHYGRPGRIPGSVNVPARSLIDPATGKFLPRQALRAMFERVGAFEATRVITYSGSGIAASATAFVLELLGHPDWALYDNSLLEWSARADTEMVTE